MYMDLIQGMPECLEKCITRMLYVLHKKIENKPLQYDEILKLNSDQYDEILIRELKELKNHYKRENIQNP
jgi:hypothetical protein